MIRRAYILYEQLDGGLNALNFFHYTQSDYLSGKVDLPFAISFSTLHRLQSL